MGTPPTNSPNTYRLSSRQTRIAKRIRALGTLAPTDPLAIEVLIYPRRIEIRPLDDALDAEPVAIGDQPPKFRGPLASLKRFASDNSRPGYRIFVTERRNKLSPVIKIEARTNQGYWSKSFRKEADARRYVEAQVEASQAVIPIHTNGEE